MRKDLTTLLMSGDTATAARQLEAADPLLAQASAADPKWVAPIVMRGWLAYQHRALAPPLDKTYVKGWLEKALGYGVQALQFKPNDAMRWTSVGLPDIPSGF